MLEQSLWWLLPYVLLLLVMLHAMMEFTVSLLVQRPQTKRKPIPASELRRRLLAANEVHQPFTIVEGKDSDLEIAWESEEVAPPGRWAITRAASGGRVRLLLDAHRHELRMNQVTHGYSFFLGWTGWLPRLGGYAGFQSGPPARAMATVCGRIANQGGWSARPVLWWFQATHGGYRWLERFTPGPLRAWPARRFWGILYPLTYVLGMGYLAVIVGSFDRNDWLLLTGISAAWWSIWGLLTWMLCGFPAFWHHKGR